MEVTVINHIHRLAALPVGHLVRQDTLRRRMRGYRPVFDPYRQVFTTGMRSYQQHTYIRLVQRLYSRQVAHQVRTYQHRLLDFMIGTRGRSEQVLDLVAAALDTAVVHATTVLGDIEIPIEMNVALALLLGLPESPDYATTSERRTERIFGMQAEVDWLLAYELVHARTEMTRRFSPLLGRPDAHGEEAAGISLSG